MYHVSCSTFALLLEFSYEKCSEFLPEILEPLFKFGPEKLPQIISAKFLANNPKEIHRRASAGAQGE